MMKMQVKYIFLRKISIKESRDLSVFIAPFDEMFNRLFENVTGDSFDVIVDDRYFKVKHKYSSENNGNTSYLIIAVEGTLFQCAKILNEANSKLIKGEHRRDYNIILSFDGVSNYYCNRIYPKFNLFERKIRELIIRIIIKSFGIKWFDETVSDNLKTEIKKGGMKQSDLIEKAIHELTIYQLETYLFTPYRELDIDSVLEKELCKENLNNKTKDEIINILNKCRAKSLWDRFFEGKIKITNLQVILERIRVYRNNVAHSKYFYNDDYINCGQLLNKIIKQLDEAINEIEMRTFSKIDISGSLGVLSETIDLFFKDMVEIMTPAMKSISEVLKQFTILPKIQFNIPKIDSIILSKFEDLRNMPKTNYYLLLQSILKNKNVESEIENIIDQDKDSLED